MKKLILAIFCLTMGLEKSFAQLAFERDDSIVVIKNDEPLLNPWAGGFNSPQFSKVDLGSDSPDDLVVFDRVADRLLLFENIAEGSGQPPIYKHRYDYLMEVFPEMQNWVLMRDYNCDGLMDIFTSETAGVRVYQNTGDFGPSFEIADSLLTSSYNFGTPFDAPIYCIGLDLPAIVDYDNDGDLDFFSFTESSSTIYYYCGLSSQLDDCESLAFELGNRCWGYVREGSEDNTLFLGEECSFNVVNPRDNGGLRHTGGSLASKDLNADGFKEMVIGDVSYSNLKTLLNGPGEQGPDSVVAEFDNFPATLSNTVPVDLQIFPAAYFEDFTGDGISDLIAAPNASLAAEDNESAWLYQNNGTEDEPEFEFIQTDFLQDGMIEVGTNAYPTMFDHNADGLPDLLVANKYYYEPGGSPSSRISLYENSGTVDEPEFTFITDDYAQLGQFTYVNIYPAFADIDDDGDQDMLIGENGGRLRLFTNIAGPNETAQFNPTPMFLQFENGEEIDLGVATTPQFFDVDGDELTDLLVGEKNGNINYLKNVGTQATAQWELIEDTLGGVVASNFLGINGYSIPHMFIQNGERKLLVGTETGRVNFYDNIDGNLDGDFQLVEETLAHIREGENSAVWLENINGDQWPDLFYGQIGGGVAFYEGIDPMVSVGDDNSPAWNFIIYPNPAQNLVQLELEEANSAQKTIEVKDALGRNSLQPITTSASKIQLDMSSLSAGFYFVVVNQNSERLVKKIIVE